MQTSTWKTILALSATADLAIFGAVIVGGNSCGRGDGCLFYSGLFAFGLFVATVVLIPSAVIWAQGNSRSSSAWFFRLSTSALFIVAALMLAATAFGRERNANSASLQDGVLIQIRI